MKLILENSVQHIPIKIFQYNTFLKRLKGLMFRMKPIVKEGILLSPCNSIHMFFMNFSIDVVFLNDKNQIIFIKENVKPWSVIFPIKHAVSALELPNGTISKYSIQLGAFIEI
ncbi:hypothetical protein BKP37_16745 [Anaerobacillus alkalilacustris]|uniref:DUF192 domain-containing protein n=1 Tax=Anaerobacillus alkalilacustris TaxID=393763 RepID=A0A1S2LEX6_9BACI|nr:DUF192 domain-containing protein [Anaerobacillus alkalilacustris]OIJ11058.1 hypothetical protein BKP37_16745 [Anaerobacillus alkalilacustris]